MVWKKLKEDIESVENNAGDKIIQGEKFEIIEVWLNNIRNDIYVKLKTEKGGIIITSIKLIELN